MNFFQVIKCSGNSFDAVMTFYGMEYLFSLRRSLVELTKDKFPSFLSQPAAFVTPESFPKCYHNDGLDFLIIAVYESLLVTTLEYYWQRSFIECNRKSCFVLF